jgi:hypothetical protein
MPRNSLIFHHAFFPLLLLLFVLRAPPLFSMEPRSFGDEGVPERVAETCLAVLTRGGCDVFCDAGPASLAAAEVPAIIAAALM